MFSPVPLFSAQDVEVSADCLDILTRVLVASPVERMSMDVIKTHPWFLKGLPPGALEMNDFLLQGLANQEEVRLPSHLHLCTPKHSHSSEWHSMYICRSVLNVLAIKEIL